jgi:hypothetical protein
VAYFKTSREAEIRRSSIVEPATVQASLGWRSAQAAGQAKPAPAALVSRKASPTRSIALPARQPDDADRDFEEF